YSASSSRDLYSFPTRRSSDLSNLDFITVSKLRKMIDKWKVAGKTVVIAEHRLYYLLGIVDRFVVLNNGTIENIYSCDEFSAMRKDRKSTRLNSSHVSISYAVF